MLKRTFGKSCSKESTRSYDSSHNAKQITAGVWNNTNKFHLAIQAGQVDEVARMLEEGIDPNETNTMGNTGLHTASKNISKEIMDLLITSGADVNRQNDNKMSPLHFVVLSRGGANEDDDPALDCLRLLLNNTADVDLRDHSGATALHLAAIRSEEGWVNALIEGGASLCAKTDKGEMALYYVMKNCPNSIMKSLDACFLGLDGNLNRDKLDAIIKSSDKEKAEVLLNFKHLQTKSNSDFTEYDPTHFFEKVLDMKDKDPTLHGLVKDTFLHPASQVYIYYKWCSVLWWYYTFILVSHLVYSLVFSVYAVLVFKDICPPPEDLRQKDKWECDWGKAVKEEKVSNTKIAMAEMSWLLLIPFTIILVIKQITHFAQRVWNFRKKEYSSWIARVGAFMDLSAFFGWLLVISFCMGSFNEWPIGKPKIDLPEYKYHVVVYGVFLSWLHMMILWGRATKVGLYVKLLKKVAKTFIYSISAYSPLFLGFALSFYILFPNMQFTENIGFAVLKVWKVIICK